ncbi:Bcmia40 [Botrytis cinerea B05.10]|uniref:Mitochondrial intermembrane space import and assembly protein 40 n=2 Tax=Botryotinia fuckeliana TaxID=40559 RepID=A0A384JXX8_BOTFB|nr:Bcmia40 [Botrytis cinerea B05.10]ATZ55423.1 Bcmia40 [Botrytis cinerea B05.10]CCD45367.1 hypothetical protein BofuT4_P120730.1 [Botrytis cinerea T4]
MFKSVLRVAPKCSPSQSKSVINATSARRFLSSAPPSQKSRSWKGSAARWALAGAGVYWYNTSNVFAEEPEAIQKLDESIHRIRESDLPTLDAVIEEKRKRHAELAAEQEKREHESAAKAVAAEGGAEEEGEMEGLEDEAGQQGAFNPETGEINWDCPCLGGMAHGPCGEEFKAAFSCFVHSTEEPKGVECIEKFKGMQDCFRAHPEMYASELENEEDEIEEELRAREAANGSEEGGSEPLPQKAAVSRRSEEQSEKKSEGKSEPTEPTTQKATESNSDSPEEKHRDSRNSTTPESTQNSGDEGGDLVPRAAHDATTKK